MATYDGKALAYAALSDLVKKNLSTQTITGALVIDKAPTTGIPAELQIMHGTTDAMPDTAVVSKGYLLSKLDDLTHGTDQTYTTEIEIVHGDYDYVAGTSGWRISLILATNDEGGASLCLRRTDGETGTATDKPVAWLAPPEA